jgi:hypothetical protein
MKTYESNGYEAAPLEKSAGWVPVVIVTSHGTTAYEPAVPVVAEAKGMGTAKGIALFLAAPFIGLAYLLAMPLVGLCALAWIAAKALATRFPATKAVGLTIAAPFIGLAFIVAAPFVGLGALVSIGARSATR